MHLLNNSTMANSTINEDKETLEDGDGLPEIDTIDKHMKTNQARFRSIEVLNDTHQAPTGALPALKQLYNNIKEVPKPKVNHFKKKKVSEQPMNITITPYTTPLNP